MVFEATSRGSSSNKDRVPREPELSYTIRVRDSISERWIGWFGNMTVIERPELSPGAAGLPAPDQDYFTVVKVNVADQAALLGILQKLHNLGTIVESVQLEVARKKESGSDKR